MIQPSADPEASTALETCKGFSRLDSPELGGAFSSEPSRHLVIRVSVSVGGAENVHESEGRFTPAETRIGRPGANIPPAVADLKIPSASTTKQKPWNRGAMRFAMRANRAAGMDVVSRRR